MWAPWIMAIAEKCNIYGQPHKEPEYSSQCMVVNVINIKIYSFCIKWYTTFRVLIYKSAP